MRFVVQSKNAVCANMKHDKCGVQTVSRSPDQNCLRGLCQPLHLPYKSDAVMEHAAMETIFGLYQELNRGPFIPESKTLTTVPRCSSVGALLILPLIIEEY